MAVAGVGVDIVEIARMERVLARTPSFARRVFTDEERAYCERTAHPAEHYACRFAAREAVLKALGCGFGDGVSVQDVSVTRDASGHPQARISGRAAQIAQDQDVLEVEISLSRTAEMAVANAVAVTEAARPRKEEERDPRAELAASFKEARSVIDELERVQTMETGGSAETPDEIADVADATPHEE